ncbi:hypothetical protein OIC43_36910 [Streptomyces sp. NBC_00825]|uniref:hypothetical protein n=1 Tax=unclassified Streptomyces TaxID=2593676 RepID=UPI002ED2706F|nr:hypothetical protein OG832_06780 [Streptomyces sp. NBC_00826]WTH94219.1 hypothetical protein OIC43_36910 [Streptomyces sp. NBC_00825]WTI02954.1 hypothetical protein OHA23_36890 [Streptomyces sp. NBC_00822]
MNELPPNRVEEIHRLVVELTTTAKRTDLTTQNTSHLLRECGTALTELLDERDALVRANAAAGEELACWTGALRWPSRTETEREITP